ncbi:hypothetical protein [Streptomyces xanthophaeus]|uniref:hypothetical protein n=1 Tax=Streptomyces xanthophaeus TaxID=67385 RepID=UPI0026488202|nr:hypothetical protein [Streptomyces xanthophaeus]WKD32962.1 hypothetical protein KO717_14005 [Streptomyces xanthophaeus]
MRMKARATMVALVPTLLFAAVGCSTTHTPATGGAPDPKGSAGSASAAPGVPAPSAVASGSVAPKTGGSRLERSALAQGDLPGYQVSAQGKNPNAPDGQPQADKKACQPLADIMGDKPDPSAREVLSRGVGSQKQVGLAVSATVSSYSESDAKALIARLKAAVAACGSGFSATVGKQTGAYREVRPADYRTGGDESVSWTMTAAAQGVSAQVHLVVVREGDTVARLTALNVVAAAQQKAQVPQEVADKQLEKIQKVRRAG